jgi:hypothetical protein
LPAPSLRCAGRIRLDVTRSFNWIEGIIAMETSWLSCRAKVTTIGTGQQLRLNLRRDHTEIEFWGMFGRGVMI